MKVSSNYNLLHNNVLKSFPLKNNVTNVMNNYSYLTFKGKGDIFEKKLIQLKKRV